MSADPLASFMARLPEIIERALKRALEDGLAVAKRRLRPGGGGPVSRTGVLERSLGARVRRQGDTFIGELYSTAPYAAAQEHGAVIQAKRREYLKFKVQGQWVQKRRVELPARPFLRPGRDAAAAALKRRLAEALREELS